MVDEWWMGDLFVVFCFFSLFFVKDFYLR